MSTKKKLVLGSAGTVVIVVIALGIRHNIEPKFGPPITIAVEAA